MSLKTNIKIERNDCGYKTIFINYCLLYNPSDAALCELK
jgi:hypothetical protein